jgi:aryl sulfotransferase
MEGNKTGAVWLASYPKSGNTWLRLLLEAYRRNGLLDINDLRMGTSDGGAGIIRAVCPIPLDAAAREIQLLLRPAALMNLLCTQKPGTQVKTHFANVRPDGDLPHCIPKALTRKAVYVIRDPRSVVLSGARHFKYSVDAMVEEMDFKEFTIGGFGEHASTLVSSWSNHVASWVGEKEFPVHVVKYEDMMVDAGKELTEVLEFLEEEIDPKIVKKAVKACEMAKLEQAEDKDGFSEASGKGRKFFGGGGTRWQDELGPKWIKQIEEDHGDVMRAMGYLEGTVAELKAVE